MQSIPRLLILLSSFLWYHVVQSQVQYCHEDSSSSASFCMAMISVQNDTTKAMDFHVTLQANLDPGIGWQALGIGERMVNSVVFILAVDEKNNMVLSVREALGNIEPKEAPTRTPKVEIVSRTEVLAQKGWQEIGFICYACDAWRTVKHPLSNSQPWIWARNPYQPISVATSDMTLQVHDDIGNFYMDLPMSITKETSTNIAPPAITDMKSVGVTETAPAKTQPVKLTSIFHGLFLGFAFMLLFPAGAVTMALRPANAFNWHVTIQTVASGCILIGIGIKLIPILRNGYGSYLLTLHPMIGIFITLAIAVQFCLGIWHHVRFVKIQKRTNVTTAHVFLGRTILVSGAINTAIGLRLAKQGLGLLLVWLMVAFAEGVVLVVVFPRILKRRRARTEIAGGDEDESKEHLLQDGRFELENVK